MFAFAVFFQPSRFNLGMHRQVPEERGCGYHRQIVALAVLNEGVEEFFLDNVGSTVDYAAIHYERFDGGRFSDVFLSDDFDGFGIAEPPVVAL